MSITYQDLERNGYRAFPGDSILSGMLGVCDGFLANEIKHVFNMDTVMKLLMGSPEEREQILTPYDGYTWESVFANLKCKEIHGFVMSDDHDQSNLRYMSYMERLHQIDPEELINSFKAEKRNIFGAIYGEIWSEFKEAIIKALSENKDSRSIYEIAQKALEDGIVRALSKYQPVYQDPDEFSSFSNMMNETQDIYKQILNDPRVLFKTNYVSLVMAAEVLVCNPEYLPFGDRLVSAIKYLMTGASICIGNTVTDMLKNKYKDLMDKMGDDGMVFVSSFVSSGVCYVMILMFDRNPVLKSLIEKFNQVATITADVGYYRQMAEKFETYAAELEGLDIAKLKKEVSEFAEVSAEMEQISSAEELNRYLLDYYKRTGLELPWGNKNFDDFWADPNRRLVFN